MAHESQNIPPSSPPQGLRYDNVAGVCEPDDPSSCGETNEVLPDPEEGSTPSTTFTESPPPQQQLRETVKTPDPAPRAPLFAPGNSGGADPSLYQCREVKTPEDAAFVSAQYASGDPDLQRVAVESLRNSDQLNFCPDPRYEENEVYIVAMSLSSEDPVVASEGDLALRYLVSTNPDARERIEVLAQSLEETGGDFEQNAAAVLRETLQETEPVAVGRRPIPDQSGVSSGSVVATASPASIESLSLPRAPIPTLANPGRILVASPDGDDFSIRVEDVTASDPSDPVEANSLTAVTSFEIDTTQTSSLTAAFGFLNGVIQGAGEIPVPSEQVVALRNFFVAVPTDPQGRVLLADSLLRALLPADDRTTTSRPVSPNQRSAPPITTRVTPQAPAIVRIKYDPKERRIEIVALSHPVDSGEKIAQPLGQRRLRLSLSFSKKSGTEELSSGPVFVLPPSPFPKLATGETEVGKAVLSRAGSPREASERVVARSRSGRGDTRHGSGTGRNPHPFDGSPDQDDEAS